MDAVITWVDGSDPVHAQKRRLHAGPAFDGSDTANIPTRFDQRGEVFWALGSLLRFAPFLRRIHLLTDAQVPAGLDRFERAGLCEPGRIRVADHRDAFRGHEDALPSFNSTTIEAMLWRIPGLDEEFVYLNDDFLLLRPHAPEDFFREGRPVIRGRWTPALPVQLKTGLRAGLRRLQGRPPANRHNYRLTHLNAARLAGSSRGPLGGVLGRFVTYGHHPHPLRRSLFEAFWAARPEVLARHVRHRFRDRSQFSSIALGYHLALASPEGAVLAPPAGELILDFSKGELPGAARRLRESRAASACIQSLDLAPEAEARELAAAVAERLGPWLPPP